MKSPSFETGDFSFVNSCVCSRIRSEEINQIVGNPESPMFNKLLISC